MPRDDEIKDYADECLEEKNCSAFKVSKENPFLNGWTNGVSNASYHPRNDECIEANVTNMIPKKILLARCPRK